LDGGEAQKIYEYVTSIRSYDWSPDGQKLAFVANQPKEEESNGLPYQPEIYEENLTLAQGYITDLAGAEPEPLGLDGSVYGVHWSPDGQHLAVSHAPSPLVDDYYTSQKITIVSSDNFSQIAEVDHQGKLGAYVWSPDGTELAMIGGADPHDPIEGRLFIVDARSGEVNTVLPDFLGMFESIVWKEDNVINLIASEGVSTTVGRWDNQSREMTKDIDRGEVAYSHLDVAKDGTMVLVGSTAQHPAEVFLQNSASTEPRRMTNSNPWLADKQLARQEVITYSANDGLEIKGILIHPLNEQSGQKYPLITVVHGGPEAHYDNGWLTSYSSPGQMAAAQGYAVFYPNYRGSTGRGLEFAMSSQGDPGGKEFDDVIDGIDYLIESGLVDEEKVGVTGGSYGGYATGWMATRYSERFAAGVMFVGISNNLSKWGTSDIPEEMFLVHSRKRIWDDYQFFLERSPIYYADQAQTPLLIMAGKEDTRVDPGQSYELYRHIKTRTDTPVRLVLYPGEGHGNRNATARLDYNLRMMRWFDTYLKSDDSMKPEGTIEMEVSEN